MKKQEYNIPQKGAVKKLREVYNEQRKRKPSDTLIEILREPSKKKDLPKVARSSKKLPDVET